MKIHMGDRARRVLDLAATIVMLSVAAVFIAVAANQYLRRQRPPIVLEPPMPAGPVSLEGAMIAGCPQAAVAVIEWADFRCGACRLFAQRALPSIRRRYVDSCKLLLVFRHLPIAARDPFALRAAEAAACAGRQGKFWPMHDLLFGEQARLQQSGLPGLAKRAGIDEGEFTACLDSGSALPQIRLDAGAGLVLGASGTPTLLFGIVQKDNTVQVVRRVSRALELGDFEEIVEGLLRTHKPL